LVERRNLSRACAGCPALFGASAWLALSGS
jgi:hypothetical protein